MIEIELRAKDGHPYRTEPHPAFVDYQLRETGISIETIVGIHAENLVAPAIAALAGKNALATYPELSKAANDVAGGFPNAEDAARILALLVPWSRNFPDGLWVIAGAELVPTSARYIAIPTEPRFSARSLAIDPMRYGVTFIGEADRMDDMDGVDLEPLDRADISIAEAMRRPRTNPDDKSSGSSGSKGRAKSRDGGKTYLDAPEPAKSKTSVVGVRVVNEIKAALDAEPEIKRELFEAVGAALISGTKYPDVVARIRELTLEGLTAAETACDTLPQPPVTPEWR